MRRNISAVPLTFALQKKESALIKAAFSLLTLTRSYERIYYPGERIRRAGSEGIPLKKYRLRTSTNRALSVSLPSSEFFVIAFYRNSISHFFKIVNILFKKAFLSLQKSVQKTAVVHCYQKAGALLVAFSENEDCS